MKQTENYYKRRIQIEVLIKRPEYTSSVYSAKDIVKFISTEPKDSIDSNALIAYNFSESISSPESTFSLSLTPEKDKNGKLWIDKLKSKDLVFIKEQGKTRFAGAIGDIRYSASMSDEGGPDRSITVTGVGFGTLLSQFTLVLDFHLWLNNSTTKGASTKLKAAIESNVKESSKLAFVLKTLYEAFFELVEKIGEASGSFGLKAVLNEFIDYKSNLSDKIESKYPQSLSLYQVGENSIWDIWSNILTPPIHELFGRWNPEKEKYELIFRQAPFEKEDWSNLKAHELHPLILKEYNLGKSDADVKTFFLGCLPGSQIDRNKALVLEGDYKGFSIASRDTEKWAKYGYRPMIVEFKYFDRSKMKDFNGSKAMEELSEMMMNWYQYNDEFLTGSFSIENVDDKKNLMEYPLIGEKLTYEGIEFYIESTESDWKYEGELTRTLTVTRGYRYSDSDGSYLGPLENIGQKIKKIEEGAKEE